jgi:hypothetical protein
VFVCLCVCVFVCLCVCVFVCLCVCVFGMCGTVYGVKILNFGGVGFWAGKIILGDFFFEGLIKDGASILRENIKKSKISLENF